MKSPVRSFCYLVLFCLLACQALALAAPVITTHPADISGAIGTQAIFTVVATGNPAPTYQWLLNGAPVAGQTAASFTPFIVDGYHNGWTFTCVVTNSSGTVTSRTATLTVSGSTPAAPAIMIQPADIIRPIGTQATFTVWATGNPAPTYQWLLNGTPVAGLTTATWPPFTVDGYHNGWTFTCVATNASGTVTSRSATLTVGAAGGGPTITTQPTDVIRAIGSPATFTVVATGTPAPTYQWLINGVPVNRQTAASFTPFIVDAYHNGWTFACVVTNVHGTVTSRAAIVVVGAPPDSNSFGYDAAGRLTSSIQADGLTWAYSPDAEGSVLTTAQAAADTSASGGLGNGIPDWWELSYFGSRLADSLARPFAAQGDYTSYLMKFALGVDPTAKYSGQAFTSGTLAYIDGRSYRSVTFIRSRNAGAMLSPQQSSDGVNWFSGPAYFAEVSVEDLGDGTERVVMRCLTALPAGANLLFRLKADGGAGYVDYSSAPAVIPAAPGWALAGLGLVLLIAIAGRSLRRGSLAGAASLVVVLLMVFHSQAQAQVDESGDPGWIAIGASPDAPARATLLSPMASLGTQSMFYMLRRRRPSTILQAATCKLWPRASTTTLFGSSTMSGIGSIIRPTTEASKGPTSPI